MERGMREKDEREGDLKNKGKDNGGEREKV